MKQMSVYIGTYVSEKSIGTIYEYLVDAEEKKPHFCRTLQAGPNPSFIIFNQNKSVLYAVNELDKETDGSFGDVTCLFRQEDGNYTYHGRLSTEGNYPCHVAISRDETLLFVTNYGSGSLAVFSLDERGGIREKRQFCRFQGFSVHKERQESSHVHQSLVSPCGKFLFVTDLGSDCIYCFSIDPSKEEPLELQDTVAAPKGTGPRHMAVSEKEKYIYVSAELSSSVLVFLFNAESRKLEFCDSIDAFDRPDPYPETSASEIAYYNKRVYMANRGADSISIFKEVKAGTLEFIHNVSCGGKVPRNFKIFPENYWGGEGTLVVANQSSNDVSFFAIENDTLVKTNVTLPIQAPACIL